MEDASRAQVDCPFGRPREGESDPIEIVLALSADGKLAWRRHWRERAGGRVWARAVVGAHPEFGSVLHLGSKLLERCMLFDRKLVILGRWSPLLRRGTELVEHCSLACRELLFGG